MLCLLSLKKLTLKNIKFDAMIKSILKLLSLL